MRMAGHSWPHHIRRFTSNGVKSALEVRHLANSITLFQLIYCQVVLLPSILLVRYFDRGVDAATADADMCQIRGSL